MNQGMFRAATNRTGHFDPMQPDAALNTAYRLVFQHESCLSLRTLTSVSCCWLSKRCRRQAAHAPAQSFPLPYLSPSLLLLWPSLKGSHRGRSSVGPFSAAAATQCVSNQESTSPHGGRALDVARGLRSRLLRHRTACAVDRPGLDAA